MSKNEANFCCDCDCAGFSSGRLAGTVLNYFCTVGVALFAAELGRFLSRTPFCTTCTFALAASIYLFRWMKFFVDISLTGFSGLYFTGSSVCGTSGLIDSGLSSLNDSWKFWWITATSGAWLASNLAYCCNPGLWLTGTTIGSSGTLIRRFSGKVGCMSADDSSTRGSGLCSSYALC